MFQHLKKIFVLNVLYHAGARPASTARINRRRAVQIGRYLVQSGATVRAAAQVFGVSKSTVWKDQCRLQHLAPGLWQEVRAVLLYNKAQRHLRGGEATRCKYLHAQHNHAD